MKTKVNDVKTQETTNNQQKPAPKNNKVDVDTLTFEDLKQLIRQHRFIKTKNIKPLYEKVYNKNPFLTPL